MQDSQQSRVRGPVRPPRRARWLLRGVLAIPVLFAVAAAIVWWTQGRTVAHKIQAIRERGEPVTAAELEAFYETPPHDEDATRLWTTASSYLSQAGGTQLARQLPFMGDAPEPPPPGQPWKELPLAEQFLKDNAAAMKMLHDAARTGGTARYSTDFSQGFMMLLPDVQNARQSMRCLLLEAHVRAHRGDAAGAADSLRTGLALARSMEKRTDPRFAACADRGQWHCQHAIEGIVARHRVLRRRSCTAPGRAARHRFSARFAPLDAGRARDGHHGV